MPEGFETERRYNRYSAKEERGVIAAYLMGYTVNEIAEAVGRTPGGLRTYLHRHGYGSKTRYEGEANWPKGDVDFLREHVDDMTWEEIGMATGHTASCVAKKAKREGIAKTPVGRGWTKAEEEYVRQHCNDTAYADIAEDLGRSESSISRCVKRLGLVKDRHNPRRGMVPDGEEQG